MSTIEVGEILINIGEFSNAVEVSHDYYNAGEKEIKYITFSYVPYNSVNDVVACTVSRKTEVSGQLTGPIEPKGEGSVTWDTLWFNPTVTKVVLTEVHIQFMDNTEELIDGKDIVSMDDENSAYYREVTMPTIEHNKYRSKVDKARQKLTQNYDKAGANKALAEVVSKFENDEKGLIEVLNVTNVHCAMGYILGDYIEKNYSSNKTLMYTAVACWKHSIDYQRKYYNTPDAREHAGYLEKYAAKIKKYDPAYVMPKKAGCVTVG